MESDAQANTRPPSGRAAFLIVLSGALLLVVVLSVMLGFSYRQETRLYQELSNARSRANEAQRAAQQSESRLASEDPVAINIDIVRTVAADFIPHRAELHGLVGFRLDRTL